MDRAPFSAGTYLGELRRVFEPSPSFVDFLAARTDRKVVVNEKGEWLFVCGRDLFAESVVSGAELRGRVVVVNERDEVLGLGSIGGRPKPLVTNTFDRGWYLRRESKR
ncbi:MAG: hypothetical protein HC945_04450 [Nitrosarchaeum sp.]|nr:hypothetical protein [Nitrosarchaeum sp.]